LSSRSFKPIVSPPNSNLNASTHMIADKASDLIRGKAPLEAVRLTG
jgi:hypothetical protein